MFGRLMAASGVFCGAASIAMIVLLVWGGWSAANERLILVILGCSLGGFIALMGAVIIAMALGGPVGRFKGSATKDGFSVEADGDVNIDAK